MALRVERRRHQIPDAAVRLVLALPLLVLHDAALLVEPRLRHRAEQVAHPVGLHPEDGVERRDRHVLEVVGPVLAGGAVQIGRADPLEDLEVVVVEVLRAVEHQVLEEVREAGLARPLVLGADVVPDVHGDDRRLVVLVDDERQAVGEHVARERDLRDLLPRGREGEQAAEDGGDDDFAHSMLRELVVDGGRILIQGAAACCPNLHRVQGRRLRHSNRRPLREMPARFGA